MSIVKNLKLWFLSVNRYSYFMRNRIRLYAFKKTSLGHRYFVISQIDVSTISDLHSLDLLLILICNELFIDDCSCKCDIKKIQRGKYGDRNHHRFILLAAVKWHTQLEIGFVAFFVLFFVCSHCFRSFADDFSLCKKHTAN